MRDASRLMVIEGDALLHRRFADLSDLLRDGDLMVLNETRVIPARLVGESDGKRRIELLLLHPSESLRYDPNARVWTALAKPARHARAGRAIEFGTHGKAVVRRELAHGLREIELYIESPFEEFLARAGEMPLPPYIHNDSPQARERYQTVFARRPGSVAAPTASLHFTPELLAAVARQGVEVVRIALNVGLGTFRPVTVECIDDHAMHGESYSIEPAAANAIEAARSQGRRVVAAGTTVVRALEGSVHSYGRIEPGDHVTDLFIKPGYAFRVVDALVTNFHLPRSTLLMLVSAFAGRERILRAYAEAIAQRYRFYSFGDAMLVASKKHA